MSDRTILGTVTGGVALTLATALLAGCYAPPPPPPERVVRTTTVVEAPATVVTLRPPAPRAEIIPAAPNERVVWDPGRWSWDGRGYVWVSGHYVERPYERAIWEPGHWVDRGGSWFWEEGHWRA